MFCRRRCLPEEEAAAVEANSGGDVAARNCLIEHNLRLVVFLARKFKSAVWEQKI